MRGAARSARTGRIELAEQGRELAKRAKDGDAEIIAGARRLGLAAD
ncbi:MAG TPA: hypothetical protein VF329_05680 [Gammaproteobacteria bacterium]